MKPRSETAIQIDIVDYLRKVLPPSAIVHHSKNEGNRGGRKGLLDGVRAKRMGVEAGFPDIAVYLPSQRVVFFEVKNETGRATRTQQYMWQRLKSLGFDCGLVRSIDEVRNALRALDIQTREVAS